MIGDVEIPDILELYHKPSKSIGILTRIGGPVERSTIAIRDGAGTQIQDDIKAFYFLDDTGKPIFEQTATDRFGAPIKIGTWIAYANPHHGELRVGRVERFTPIGTIMIDTGTPNTRWGANSLDKAAGGRDCIVLDETQDEVIKKKDAISGR